MTLPPKLEHLKDSIKERVKKGNLYQEFEKYSKGDILCLPPLEYFWLMYGTRDDENGISILYPLGWNRKMGYMAGKPAEFFRLRASKVALFPLPYEGPSKYFVFQPEDLVVPLEYQTECIRLSEFIRYSILKDAA